MFYQAFYSINLGKDIGLLTEQQFYAKWQVNHEAIAFICSRSISTVRCWFRRGKSYRRPMPNDLRHLALMDFVLEHWEDIPSQLKNRLCPPDDSQ